MSVEIPTKTICTIADMARAVGLSRARFYQLIGTAFPHPLYNVTTRRPFYDEELQRVCLEVSPTELRRGWEADLVLRPSPRCACPNEAAEAAEDQSKKVEGRPAHRQPEGARIDGGDSSSGGGGGDRVVPARGRWEGRWRGHPSRFPSSQAQE